MFLLCRKRKLKKRQWFPVDDGVQEVDQEGMQMEAMVQQVEAMEKDQVVEKVEAMEEVQVVKQVEAMEEVQVEVQATSTKMSNVLSDRSLHKKINLKDCHV
jgi:hypothetical protein